MLATLSVAGGLLLWECVARLLIKNPLFLAAPSETMVALVAIIRSGELGLHVWVSAIEFLIGFGIAVVAGIAIGAWPWLRPAAPRPFSIPGYRPSTPRRSSRSRR